MNHNTHVMAAEVDERQTTTELNISDVIRMITGYNGRFAETTTLAVELAAQLADARATAETTRVDALRVAFEAGQLAGSNPEARKQAETLVLAGAPDYQGALDAVKGVEFQVADNASQVTIARMGIDVMKVVAQLVLGS